MFRHIQKNYGRLLVISDTAMCNSNDGIYAFGPVVKELEEIEFLFESITWVGYNHFDKLGDDSFKKVPSTFNCILLRRTGGNSILEKIKILLNLPIVLVTILKLIPSNDVIYTRAPSLPAFLGILLSFFIRHKKWWHKYAGSWVDRPPIFYLFQKKLLNVALNSKVTINGEWPNLKKHILSFENPCIHISEIKKGRKKFINTSSGKYNLIFVGALNRLKGVDLFIEALESVGNNKFNKVVFVGGGMLLDKYKERTIKMNNVSFTGYLNRQDIFERLKEADFIVLPSFSEGFPKVLAEAAAFGVIPISTSISSIPQYINKECGYLISKPDVLELSRVLNEILNELPEVLINKSQNCIKLSELFTYERFISRIEKDIFAQ